MPLFTNLQVVTKNLMVWKFQKNCWPIHCEVERVPQPCVNENYHKLSRLHACRNRYIKDSLKLLRRINKY